MFGLLAFLFVVLCFFLCFCLRFGLCFCLSFCLCFSRVFRSACVLCVFSVRFFIAGRVCQLAPAIFPMSRVTRAQRRNRFADFLPSHWLKEENTRYSQTMRCADAPMSLSTAFSPSSSKVL